jgi:hypothetical protein
MATDVLSDSQMQMLRNNACLDSYEYTGCGYYLTVRDPSLPAKRQTLSKPAVVGSCGDVQAGFIVVLGDGKLTLECHTWGPVDIPEDFRDRAVIISTLPTNSADRGSAT